MDVTLQVVSSAKQVSTASQHALPSHTRKQEQPAASFVISALHFNRNILTAQFGWYG